jgi:hypothetical protein
VARTARSSSCSACSRTGGIDTRTSSDSSRPAGPTASTATDPTGRGHPGGAAEGSSGPNGSNVSAGFRVVAARPRPRPSCIQPPQRPDIRAHPRPGHHQPLCPNLARGPMTMVRRRSPVPRACSARRAFCVATDERSGCSRSEGAIWRGSRVRRGRGSADLRGRARPRGLGVEIAHITRRGGCADLPPGRSIETYPELRRSRGGHENDN